MCWLNIFRGTQIARAAFCTSIASISRRSEGESREHAYVYYLIKLREKFTYGLSAPPVGLYFSTRKNVNIRTTIDSGSSSRISNLC